MANVFTAPTLRGIIIRDDADHVIVRADSQDILNFAQKPGAQVEMRPPPADLLLRFRGGPSGSVQRRGGRSGPAPAILTEPVYLKCTDYLYNAEGVPVAEITQIHQNMEAIEVTSFGDVRRSYAQGVVALDISAFGLPGVRAV